MIDFIGIDDKNDPDSYFRKNSNEFYNKLIKIINEDHIGVQSLVMLSFLAKRVSELDYDGTLEKSIIRRFKKLCHTYKNDSR